MTDQHRVGEQDDGAREDQRQARRRPDPRQRDVQALQVPVTVGDQQRTANSRKHLPQVVDNVLIEEVVKLANHEHQREPAEEEGERPLRVAMLCNPGHQCTTRQQYQQLDDLDRGEFAGAVLIAPGHEFLQAQGSGVSDFQAHQYRGQQRNAEEIEDVANPGHARLYTAHCVSVN